MCTGVKVRLSPAIPPQHTPSSFYVCSVCSVPVSRCALPLHDDAQGAPGEHRRELGGVRVGALVAVTVAELHSQCDLARRLSGMSVNTRRRRAVVSSSREGRISGGRPTGRAAIRPQLAHARLGRGGSDRDLERGSDDVSTVESHRDAVGARPAHWAVLERLRGALGEGGALEAHHVLQLLVGRRLRARLETQWQHGDEEAGGGNWLTHVQRDGARAASRRLGRGENSPCACNGACRQGAAADGREKWGVSVSGRDDFQQQRRHTALKRSRAWRKPPTHNGCRSLRACR